MKMFWIGGLCLALLGCGQSNVDTQRVAVASVAALQKHSEEFREGIEEVAPGIWIAIGYGLANSILVEGDDGLIVIDTMETLAEGRKVARLFREISAKPLAAIIYTHNHTDHVFGAQAFIEELADPERPVEILAHRDTADYVYRVVSEYRPIITARSFRMFGTELNAQGLVNDGIGPFLSIDENSEFGFVAPTQTLDQRLERTIAGVDLELVHAPGETNDQIFVWLPQTRTLAVGDNLYKTFPNLYTIRGTPYRSLKQWAASIDKMRRLPVEHIAPSHTRPLHGAEDISRVLTNYRDAIRFVYDQTVRYINMGLTPDEIAARLQLPPHLASEPYLQEFYGTARWSARSVFAGNLGWFDGNPSQLDPLPPATEAARMAALAGGEDALQKQLQSAAENEDWQWALQLSDWMLRLQPESQPAREARVQALLALGEAASNPNARHYYLTSALEFDQGLRLKPVNSGSIDMVRALPMHTVMNALATNLKAEKVLDVETRVGLEFTDTGEAWTLWLRRGVLEPVPELLPDLDMKVQTQALIWKQMLGKQINPAVAIARHMEFSQGNAVSFTRFLSWFLPEREAPEPAPLAEIGLD